jgi:DNA-binding HxlR family transcriptional regulator
MFRLRATIGSALRRTYLREIDLGRRDIVKIVGKDVQSNMRHNLTHQSFGRITGGINRPGALERHIEGISTKIHSDRLRRFTKPGLFERVLFPEVPPRVEYHLTPFGKKFLRLLKEIEKLQAEFDDTKG